VLNALKASPQSVDLRQQASHFYALAARMLELFDEEELVDVLSAVRLSMRLSAMGGIQSCLQRLTHETDAAGPCRGYLGPRVQP